MPAPIYIVTKHGNVRRKVKATRYTSRSDIDDVWHVGLLHGYYVGVTMDFYFNNEPEADKFSLWQMLRPADLIDASGRRRYTVKEIAKRKFAGALNRYTDQPVLQDSWEVDMKGDDGNDLTIRFPYEKAARIYVENRTYTMRGLIGTLPAIPSAVARILEEYAERQRQEEENRRRQSEASPTPSPDPSPTPSPETPTPTPSPLPDPGVLQWWSIADGGASGYYNGKFYKEGTFLYYGPDSGGENKYTPAGFAALTSLPGSAPSYASSQWSYRQTYLFSASGPTYTTWATDYGRQYSTGSGRSTFSVGAFEWYGKFSAIG